MYHLSSNLPSHDCVSELSTSIPPTGQRQVLAGKSESTCPVRTQSPEQFVPSVLHTSTSETNGTVNTYREKTVRLEDLLTQKPNSTDVCRILWQYYESF